MIIDSHHHLWSYDPAQYAWIDDRMSVIARDFSPADLAAAAAPLGVTGAIAVQARQCEQETLDLLDAADRDDFLLGVVGWAPLCGDAPEAAVERFAGRPKLKGFRHVVQDEADPRFLLRDDFNRGVGAVLAQGLAYDILVFERQLPAAIEFVDRHEGGRFVLDHIAKPRIADAQLQPWRDNLAELAKRPGVCCKLSGVVTEADWAGWSLDAIRPYLDAALEAFGPRRLMFGSDWPVCLLAADYYQWLSTVQQWAEPLSADERDWLFCRTAASAYQLQAVAA